MKVVKIKNIVIIYPEGKIGNDSVGQYRHYLGQLISKYEQCDFIINLGNVPLISGNGLGVLVFMAKELINNNHTLSICCPSHPVNEVLTILNINCINRYQTEEQAIRTLLPVAKTSSYCSA